MSVVKVPLYCTVPSCNRPSCSSYVQLDSERIRLCCGGCSYGRRYFQDMGISKRHPACLSIRTSKGPLTFMLCPQAECGMATEKTIFKVLKVYSIATKVLCHYFVGFFEPTITVSSVICWRENSFWREGVHIIPTIKAKFLLLHWKFT